MQIDLGWYFYVKLSLTINLSVFLTRIECKNIF